MKSPILMTVSHAEPVFDRREFSDAMERTAACLYYLAREWGVFPERRAVVKIVRPVGDEPMMLSGSLLCRGPELPDPGEPFMPLVHVEATA